MAERLYRDSYEVQASAYESAGDASASIKRKLKQAGVDSTILRRIAVASYEAELNLIIHSQGGQLVMEMTPRKSGSSPAMWAGDRRYRSSPAGRLLYRQRGSAGSGLRRWHGLAQHEAERRQLRYFQ